MTREPDTDITREDFVFYEGTAYGAEWTAGAVHVGTIVHDVDSPLWGAGGEAMGYSIAFAHESYAVDTYRSGRSFVDPSRAHFVTLGDYVRRDPAFTRRTQNDWIVVPHDILVECLAEHDPSVRDRPTDPFAATDVTLPPSIIARQRILMAHLKRGGEGALRIEETAFSILRDVSLALSAARGTVPPARSSTRLAHARAVRDIRAYIAENPGRHLTVADLAQSACMAPAHFARLFRREVGTTVHRYVTHLRLREALSRLPDYEGRLTALALELGFGSAEHFCVAFKRHVGVTPSRMLQLLEHPRPLEAAARLRGRGELGSRTGDPD